MNRMSLRPLIRAMMIVPALAAADLAASGPAIGVVAADGSFQVDHAKVWASATVFDGSLIETGTAVSQVRLESGALLKLASGTRAIVYRSHAVLEGGMGHLESAPGYEIEARSLHISAADAGATARVKLGMAAPRVTVAAVAGAVRVRNAEGVLVATVEPGHSLDFEPQPAGASAPVRASGCLLEKGGRFILAEQTANVVLELQGAGLASDIGNRVEIKGIAQANQSTVDGASQVIKVAGLKRAAVGGCSAAAKKIGADTRTAAAKDGSGASGAASGSIGAGGVAVIGGVAAAATIGGLAAVGNLPGQADSLPPASR